MRRLLGQSLARSRLHRGRMVERLVVEQELTPIRDLGGLEECWLPQSSKILQQMLVRRLCAMAEERSSATNLAVRC